MTKDFAQITRSVSASLRPLRRDAPALMGAFNALGEAAMKPGALDAKTKELIALALGVAARCDPCLGFHAKALVELGARREEVEEAVGVAVYMGGGPALMYAGEALDAFTQFAAAAQEAA
jgi:AhpD family alkylhydroperoxidase